MRATKSLQDQYAPNGVCFGCGPKNKNGLKLKSFPSGEGVVAEWAPEPYHVAFGNYGSGGVISVLLDCQGNWAATYALMQAMGLPAPPGTVTSVYTVRFFRPSPVDTLWQLTAKATKVAGNRVEVSGELKVNGVVTASMTGEFVAVDESHPAFYRWH